MQFKNNPPNIGKTQIPLVPSPSLIKEGIFYGCRDSAASLKQKNYE